MKQFLQIAALLAVLLGFGVQESKADYDFPIYPGGERFERFYGESFDVGDFRFYRPNYFPGEDKGELKVSVGATDEFRATGVRAVLPTQVEYDGKIWEVTGIAHGGFKECGELREVIIPNTDYTIGWSAFWKCWKLGPSITIPGETDPYMSRNTFEYTPNLTELRLEKSDRRLIVLGEFIERLRRPGSLNFPTLITGRDMSFGLTPYKPTREDTIGCLRNLKNLTILDGADVTNLFKFTRWSVENLTYGSDVTGIPASLADHEKLQSITLTTETPPVCPEFTAGQFAAITLNVPPGCHAIYRRAEGWKKFLKLYESGIDSPAIEPSERTLIGRYDLQGRPVADDYRGLVIERYSDGTAAKKVINR